MTLRSILRVFGHLLPATYRDAILQDLEDGFRRRGSIAGGLWLVRELVLTPYLALWSEAGRRDVPFLRAAGCDLLATARGLGRRRAFALAAVSSVGTSVCSVALVVGIGSSLRPPSIPGEGEVVEVWGKVARWRESDVEAMRQNWDATDLSGSVVGQLRVASGSTAIGGFRRATPSLDLDTSATPVVVEGAWITPGFFEVLNVTPDLGRVPSEAEVGRGAPVLVIGRDLWMKEFAGAQDVLGRQVLLDARPMTIIGVMPPSFRLPGEIASWWAPMTADMLRALSELPVLRVVARVPRGASLSALSSALTDEVRALIPPESGEASVSIKLTPLGWGAVRPAHPELVRLGIASVAVGFVSLITFVLLVSARTARRRVEFTTRAALGAGWNVPRRVLLYEIVLISGLALVLGSVVARTLVSPVLDVLASALPGLDGPFSQADDAAVVAAAALVACLASTAAWLACAGQIRPVPSGRAEARVGSRRGPRLVALVTAETSVATLLTVAAGFLFLYQWRLQVVGHGFDSEALVFAALRIPAGTPTAEEPKHGVSSRLERRAAALPHVAGAGVTDVLPGMGWWRKDIVRVANGPDPGGGLYVASEVSRGYMGVMGLRILSGRGFLPGDERRNVVVLSETLASLLFPGTRGVGRDVLLSNRTRVAGSRLASDSETPHQVIGIVSDVRLTLGGDREPILYTHGRNVGSDLYLVARLDGEIGRVPPALTSGLDALDNLFLVRSGFVEQELARWSEPGRTRERFIRGLGLLSILMTVVAMHAAVSYVIALERTAVGIRKALGATSSGEARRLLRFVVLPMTLGGGSGLILAWVLVAPTASPDARLAWLEGVTAALGLTASLLPAVLAAGMATLSLLTVDPARTLLSD